MLSSSNPRAMPRERTYYSCDGMARKPSDCTHLILEQVAQRFDDFERHSLWQSTDVVVCLDFRSRPLHHIQLKSVGGEVVRETKLKD